MTHFTRSRLHEAGGHKAAGVLPLALEGTGPVLVLLGAEPCRTGPGGRVSTLPLSPAAASSASAATALHATRRTKGLHT